MVFAADYPFLDILWTMLIFFAWVIWFWILIKIVADIFRRHDVGGGKKTLWMIFVIFAPFLGVFAYLLANGNSMAERDMNSAMKSQAQFDSYVQTVASKGNGGAASEIDRAKQLLDNGTITSAEFEALKAKALA
jgi:type IV secretory pathway TrbL component